MKCLEETAPDSVFETFESLERRLDAVAAERGELTLTVPMACFVARRQVGARPGIP